MRNIFVEGVRSAFIRIIRMITYIVIGLIIFYIIGLFTNKKVHALTIKENVSLTFSTNQEFSGTLTGSNQNTLQYRWSAVSNSSNYDYLAIRIQPYYDIRDNVEIDEGNIYFTNMNSIAFSCDNGGNGFCNYGHVTIPSTAYLQPANANLQTGDGDYVLTANVVYSGNNNAEGCFFTSEYQNMIICPFKHDIVGVNLYLSGYRLDTLYYKIYMSGNALAINNESTEIVNALNGVRQQQQTSITIIQQQLDEQEQQNQYMQSDNVTSSTTSMTTSITTMTDDISQRLTGASELTQIVLAPLALLTGLATDTCAPLVLQVPFVNYTANLPCMKPVFNQYFNGLYSIFTTIISAIMTYWISVKTFSLIKDILDCDNDRIEVIDL